MKNNHIVFTTVNTADVLFDLNRNLERYGHRESTICWVVGDEKTPARCEEVCSEVAALGLETHYLSISIQDEWGNQFPEFYRRVPYNNESRRNIGYLFALEHGCTRLISIDDDNFPTEDDFIGGHLQTGKNFIIDLIQEPTGFHNICEYLAIEPHRQIFPRGFPFELRGQKNTPTEKSPSTDSQIGVTEGLWIKEPDVDATTWLNGRIESKAYQGPQNFILSQNTWSPINTQNTSIIRSLIPGFICVPMCYPLPGGRIERYGDVWGGYFLQAILSGTPYHVSFGHPIVEHRRNPHIYLNDLRLEFWGMILTDWLVKQLRERFLPTSSTIIDRVNELSEFLILAGKSYLPEWCPVEMGYFVKETAVTLRLWADVCSELL